MEQARYLMWTKRKHDFSTHHHVLSSSNPSSFGDSTWEEQAFAEDAAGPLGGCIWPPRSYSCSFCRREFKSAQALGGHMNVHRRDRARLKQSPNPHGAAEGGLPQNHHHHILNPGQQISCTYLYKPNSDSDDQEFLTSPSSSIRVSAPPTKIESDDKTSSKAPPDFLSSINHEERKNNTIWSNLVAEKYFHVSDLKNEDKISKSLESTNRIIRAKGEYLKADLSVSLNLLVCRNQRTSASDDVAEETPISKRRRIDASSSFTLFPKISSPADQRCHLSHSEVLKNSPTSMEDLDLELRLGDPPKVK